jgi:hypothetical protein
MIHCQHHLGGDQVLKTQNQAFSYAALQGYGKSLQGISAGRHMIEESIITPPTTEWKGDA